MVAGGFFCMLKNKNVKKLNKKINSAALSYCTGHEASRKTKSKDHEKAHWKIRSDGPGSHVCPEQPV
ncbi:MAG: hypothetical protein IKJ29_02725 [Akkermansia sp.]|nr:hypothetical protein [Akkermansia sp.]